MQEFKKCTVKSDNFWKKWDLQTHNNSAPNGEALIDKVNIKSLEIFDF